MNERTWGMVVWLGILGATGSVIAILAVYMTARDTTYELVLFIVALLFAIMGAVANVGVTRVRRQRWDGEMAVQQQRVDDLFSSAQTVSSSKSIAPAARATVADAAYDVAPLAAGSNAASLGFNVQPIAQEAAAEGESPDDEAREHERAEHGGWE